MNDERFIVKTFIEQNDEKLDCSKARIYVIWDSQCNALQINCHRKPSVFMFEKMARKVCNNLNTRHQNQTLGDKQSWHNSPKRRKNNEE